MENGNGCCIVVVLIAVAILVIGGLSGGLQGLGVAALILLALAVLFGLWYLAMQG